VLTMNSVKILHAVRSAITAIAELLVLYFEHCTLRYKEMPFGSDIHVIPSYIGVSKSPIYNRLVPVPMRLPFPNGVKTADAMLLSGT